MLKTTVICILVLCVFLCGCSATLPEKTGSIKVTSSPSGAEIYLDNEYHGTTPANITAVPAGNHTVEIRAPGYETFSTFITVTSAGTADVSPSLKPAAVAVTKTTATIIPTTTKKVAPDIHIDGYWTYPAVRSYTNPVTLLVHAEGANVGYADARVVTASANMYYSDQQICWTKLYFGTIQAGGHVTKDTTISCSLPSGVSDNDLVIRFENIVAGP